MLPVVRKLESRLQHSRAAASTTVERIGPISVRVHRPAPVGSGEALPALLWIHGGGYVIGSPLQDEPFCQMVSRRLGIVVAAVAYRRAPEYKFPIPLEDCHDGLVWLARQPGVDPDRVAIGGASAGGGLAAALALLARDRGLVHPVFQLLSYPMLDDRTVLRTDIDERPFRLWNQKANRFGWMSYLGREPGSSGVSGLAAPARHEDLAGLPPAWIGVGTCDLFHDEDLVYARRLEDAGVTCSLHVVEGAFHGFEGVVPKAGVSRDYQRAEVEALAGSLGVGSAVP